MYLTTYLSTFNIYTVIIFSFILLVFFLGILPFFLRSDWRSELSLCSHFMYRSWRSHPWRCMYIIDMFLMMVLCFKYSLVVNIGCCSYIRLFIRRQVIVRVASPLPSLLLFFILAVVPPLPFSHRLR